MAWNRCEFKCSSDDKPEVNMGKKTLVVCNVLAGIGFLIAGIGNLLHGTKWLGALFLICGPLQFLNGWLNWKREI